MGSAPRGPSFVPSMPAADRASLTQGPSRVQPAPSVRLGKIRPTVISILVIAFVAVVVAGASLVAYWGDTMSASRPDPDHDRPGLLQAHRPDRLRHREGHRPADHAGPGHG